MEATALGRVVLAAVLASVVAVLAATPARAALRWSDSEHIGAGAFPQVEIDARGNALAVWDRPTADQRSSIEYSWRPAGKGWSSPRALAVTKHSGRWDVAMNPYGRATLLWADASDRVLAAEAPTAGAPFGKPEELAASDAGNPRLALDDEGNGVAVWIRLIEHRSGESRFYTDTLFRAERRAGGQWGAAEAVADATLEPQIAVNPSGAAVLAWGSGGNTLDVTYRPPGGRFGPPESPPLRGFFPEIALGDNGHVIMTGGNTNPESDVPFALRDPVEGWQNPVGLGLRGWVTHIFAEPSGAASFVVQVAEDGGHPSSAFATRLPNGVVVGPTPLAGTDTYVCPPTMNRRGDVLIPLTRPTQSPDARMYVSGRPAGGALLPPTPISSPGQSSCVAAAVNDAGQAVVVWGESMEQLHAVVREDRSLAPLPSPPEVDVDLPSAPELDQAGALRVSVRCSSACKVRPKGVVYTGDVSKPGNGSSRRLKARRRGRLTLRFDAVTAENVREALEHGSRPWVSLSVTARGKSPRPVTVSRRLKLRGK